MLKSCECEFNRSAHNHGHLLKQMWAHSFEYYLNYIKLQRMKSNPFQSISPYKFLFQQFTESMPIDLQSRFC